MIHRNRLPGHASSLLVSPVPGVSMSTEPSSRSSPALAFVALTGLIGFTVVFAAHWWQSPPSSTIATPWLIFNGLMEFAGVFYSLSMLSIAVAFLLSDPHESSNVQVPTISQWPSVGIVYLCCDDVNRRALHSLCQLRYPGELHLVIHDDSTTADMRDLVDSIAAEIRDQFPGKVLLLRRTKKEWGKPGATNYVLKETAHLYRYFVLCDNDSTPLSKDVVSKALSYFASPEVAIVQFRSTAIVPEGSSRVSSVLSQAIDVFDVFVATAPRWGWQPFLGHNAMISVSAFQAVGGLRPFFADDLDFALRLNLRGFRVVLASDIVFGEDHPHSYAAFRARTYKWAYGCTQIWKAHGWNILTSPTFSWSERWYLFVLIGFYPIQSLLLIYLFTAHVVMPVLAVPPSPNIWEILIADALIILSVLAYTWAYFLKHQQLRGYVGFALLCSVIYGGTGLVSMRAIWDCLWGRKRRWIPTNGVQAVRRVNPGLLAEPLFSGLILCVPLICSQMLPVSPLLFLFIGIYLVVPLVPKVY